LPLALQGRGRGGKRVPSKQKKGGREGKGKVKKPRKLANFPLIHFFAEKEGRGKEKTGKADRHRRYQRRRQGKKRKKEKKRARRSE